MDFLAIIKTVAPWIGTALGGPLGGMALDAACSALGLSTKTTDALKTAISGATPEQMLALKTADQDFQVKMTQLGYDNLEKLEALAVEDRKDARAMQVATKSIVPAALAALTTVGFFGVLAGMLSNVLKAGDSQALLIMLGSLQTGWTMVMAYYFGSSAGSARKDELAAGKK
jgi:hypothetical protein